MVKLENTSLPGPSSRAFLRSEEGMAARKAPYSAKAKVWLPSYTMELDGNATGVICSIFGSLPAPQRMLALHELQELHNSISDKEASEDTAA